MHAAERLSAADGAMSPAVALSGTHARPTRMVPMLGPTGPAQALPPHLQVSCDWICMTMCVPVDGPSWASWGGG